MLDAGAALLAFDAALARRLGRPGRPALDWHGCRTADEVDEPLARVGAIARLGAMALRDDDQDAVARQPRAGETLEPRPRFCRPLL